MALDAKTIEKLKQILTNKKDELEKSLSKIAKPLDEKKGDYEPTIENIGSDWDDNTTEVEQYVDNLPVEKALEQELQEVLEALQRMEDGTYGICENCRQEIDLERLKANPAAKTCIKCN